MNTVLRGLATGLAGVFLAISASAQTFTALGEDKTALRDEQKAIFAQMFEDPDNLELMFQYALVSIELEDLEAAISTLERMLIYNKDLPRVHMELGAAYYRLGSYETAKYYFSNVLAFDDVPPQIVAKTQEFLRAIDQRTKDTVVFGTISAGLVYSSNATLGPDDPAILLFGTPAVLGAQFLENDDFGARVAGSLSIISDLDQPDSDFWRTDFSLFSLKYFDEQAADIDSLLFRTGPRLSLDDQQFGPKLRPFVEFDHVRSGENSLYATGSLGAEYTDTLSDTMSIYGSARIGYRNFINGADSDGDGDDDADGAILRATVGAAYLPSDDLVLRGAAFFEKTFANEGASSFFEGTLRASATYSYDSGFDFAGRLWSLTGYAQATYRGFDDPNVQFVGLTGTLEREDVDLRAGLRHMFHLEDGLWIALDADVLRRDSNLRQFDITNFGAGLSVGLDF
ncbi:MAG: hypothetical protein AAFN79_16795 [Pseudomonadota bacterium]